MENQNNVIPKVVVEAFNKAPETIEMLCRTGLENIKAQDNENGKQDYIHVKIDKQYVTYKVVGAHCNDVGQVAISLRKIVGKQVVKDSRQAEADQARDAEKAEIHSQMDALQDRLDDLESDDCGEDNE